jgi:histidine triad (HIT) family protein
MKVAYGCTGISIAQNNESDGNQDAWHFHVHVFPRFPHDSWRKEPFVETIAEQRAPYVAALRLEIEWAGR